MLTLSFAFQDLPRYLPALSDDTTREAPEAVHSEYNGSFTLFSPAKRMKGHFCHDHLHYVW